MNRRAAGLDRMSVLTIQKRRYARLHRRICWAFQRPTSTHFAAIGMAQTTRKAALPARTNRRYISTALEPAETHAEPDTMTSTAGQEYARKNRACSLPQTTYCAVRVGVGAS